MSDIEVIETVWIPMSDGTNLAARLWLPASARTSPLPCILEYIPYRRRDGTRMRDESMHPHFAAAGYASIRVDIRGYGDSEGVAEDEYSHQEIQDGHDAVQWIAAQDWCDGNVGMFGKSWGAYNAFQVAATRPPALKAIAPVMGTDDRWREDIHFYGGCLANDNFWWGSIMQLYNAMPPDPEIVGADRWIDMWRDRMTGAKFWPAMWLEHQTHDEMWRRGSICENYAEVEVPVYFFGGWMDLFRDTPFRIAEHLKGPVKILMGPWAHLYPHEGVPGPKADFVGEVIRFWDHWLKGKDTGLMDEPPLRFFLQDSAAPSGTHLHRAGRWVEEPSWPSPNVSAQTLWLNDQTLDDTAQAGTAMSICSPQTFGAAAGDMCSFAIPGDMAADCRIDAGGALQFKGAPLIEPLDLLGQPSIDLTVSADKPQGFVAALLVDEAPDGAQTLIARGFCNLNHRESDTQPTPITPGEDMTVTVPMYGTGYRVPMGHRVTLQIASAYWPVLWSAPQPVTLTIRPGASRLILPVRTQPDGSTEPRPLPEPAPPTAAPRKTHVRSGSMERSVHTDLTTGEMTHRFFLDGGVFGPVGDFRLDDIGTVLSDVSDRRYTIHPSDPLSAVATMEQTAGFDRDDWSAKIWTYSEQRATATEFHLTSRLKAWSGDELIFEEEETHIIPRNGM
ncbi:MULTISPECIES: CocE/NonD family hydrolase [unclassified Ruegeria]|uniref:CocE/NonD family hydrolase n=1 Tax=unclassified Ruegeria TaxID=2625375 RepID=UPI0014926E34|nr:MULTISPECIES: CocE/NonD family hydrolase [unclassified Ruegeria]NOD89101.1 CocE/NonD family hydrolase [Ruegeria sp. HKCCD4318]NOE13736.1 CocE/NonD family hydrolase [Ruegeria sp. HKCCD4318-2]NOG07513.1 CocE/NonD family hydrolase [Ruegeria sp. HKCCD4315]